MEIERRWLVEGWPALTPSAVLQMDQGYLAVRSVIRIRREAALGGETRHVPCFRGGAGLTWEEVEVDVDEGRYLYLMVMLSGPMIEKEQHRYPPLGGLTLEVNQVDLALESGFYYVEVEFDTEAVTLAWTPLEALTAYLSHEVISQSGESMAAYWASTRGWKNSPAGMACGGVSLSKKPFRQVAELFEISKKFQRVV